MTTRLTFLGAAGYVVDGPAKRVIIDPFLTGSPCPPIGVDDIDRADVILVTHAAPDHIGDAAAISLRTGAPVVCGADTRAVLIDQGVPASNVRATIWGIVVEVGGVVIRPVESHHWSSAVLADGAVITGTPLGFIFEVEPGVRLYHWGDSAIFGDLALIGRLYRPDVALIGPTHPKQLIDPVLPGPGRILTGEMSPHEAALAAEMLGVRLAVATHYFDPADEDVVAFLELASRTQAKYRAVAPRVGETIAVEPDGWATVPINTRGYTPGPADGRAPRAAMDFLGDTAESSVSG